MRDFVKSFIKLTQTKLSYKKLLQYFEIKNHFRLSVTGTSVCTWTIIRKFHCMHRSDSSNLSRTYKNYRVLWISTISIVEIYKNMWKKYYPLKCSESNLSNKIYIRGENVKTSYQWNKKEKRIQLYICFTIFHCSYRFLHCFDLTVIINGG